MSAATGQILRSDQDALLQTSWHCYTTTVGSGRRGCLTFRSWKPAPNKDCHTQCWSRIEAVGCRTAGEVLGEEREQSRQYLLHSIWYHSNILASRDKRVKLDQAGITKLLLQVDGKGVKFRFTQKVCHFLYTSVGSRSKPRRL